MNAFTDDLGYLRCPGCEHQIAANLWCDRCEDYAWAHPKPVTLVEFRRRILNAEKQSDGSWSVPGSELRNGTTGEWM